MSTSLFTGISGLSAHQRMLDVIGNNLANTNTTGYKTRRTLFADLVYRNLSAPAGGVDNVIGSVNPKQIGSGVRVSQVDLKFQQGNLEATGEVLDFALEGNGFFVVNSPNQQLYTRAGAFGIDDQGFLVDPSTGYFVQRFGTVGEVSGTDPSFQTAGDSRVQIPLGAVVPGAETTEFSLRGSLGAGSLGPQAEQLTSSPPWTAGSAAATGATLLNALDSNTTDYVGGDSITISGTDTDGSTVSTTFAVDNTTTFTGLLTAISGAFGGATASLDATGNLLLTADNDGPSSLSLTLSDSAGNTGATTFTDHGLGVTTTGRDGDIVRSTVEVFDEQGEPHVINLALQKQADLEWDLTATVDGGTVVDGSVQQIMFNTDASVRQVSGTGAGDANISILFDGFTTANTIDISFGTSGGFDGLSEVGVGPSISARQDGFSSGTLATVNTNAEGVLEGVASNGRRIPLAQLAVATFSNQDGLSAFGSNYFQQNVASGPAQLGSALSNGGGAVRAGELEASNVDIAREFTQLIIAQRGFSANARTITVTDEVLEELTNIVR